jgi:hypothetical protein
MMLANIPAVILGNRIADELPVKAIRITAAVVFAGLGVVTLVGWGDDAVLRALCPTISRCVSPSAAATRGRPNDRCGATPPSMLGAEPTQ